MFERGALARLGRRAVERARAPALRPERGAAGAAHARRRRARATTTTTTMTSKPLDLHDSFEDAARRAGAQTWIESLDEDPESSARAPNRTSREVRSGHYVEVEPEALANPRARLASTTCAEAIGFKIARECENLEDGFVKYFSGDVGGARETTMRTWATPYALSIMGQRMTSNCPFGNGNGYGDGRAISVGEMVNPVTGQRYELQLKGGGGDAVLSRRGWTRGVEEFDSRIFGERGDARVGGGYDAGVVFDRKRSRNDGAKALVQPDERRGTRQARAHGG